MSARKITLIASIAALYVILTINPIFFVLSYGSVQFRISEIFTVLPYLTKDAIPGLFIGTLIANLFSKNGLIDVIVGSFATLLAAWLTSKMPNRWLAPLPPVIINALLIGSMIGLISDSIKQIPFFIAYIGLGQLIVCYLLGLPFLMFLEKYRSILFDPKN